MSDSEEDIGSGTLVASQRAGPENERVVDVGGGVKDKADKKKKKQKNKLKTDKKNKKVKGNKAAVQGEDGAVEDGEIVHAEKGDLAEAPVVSAGSDVPGLFSPKPRNVQKVRRIPGRARPSPSPSPSRAVSCTDQSPNVLQDASPADVQEPKPTLKTKTKSKKAARARAASPDGKAAARKKPRSSSHAAEGAVRGETITSASVVPAVKPAKGTLTLVPPQEAAAAIHKERPKKGNGKGKSKRRSPSPSPSVSSTTSSASSSSSSVSSSSTDPSSATTSPEAPKSRKPAKQQRRRSPSGESTTRKGGVAEVRAQGTAKPRAPSKKKSQANAVAVADDQRQPRLQEFAGVSFAPYFPAFEDSHVPLKERDLSQAAHARWLDINAQRQRITYPQWVAMYVDFNATYRVAPKPVAAQFNVEKTFKSHYDRLVAMDAADFKCLHGAWLSSYDVKLARTSVELDMEETASHGGDWSPTFAVYLAARHHGVRPLGIITAKKSATKAAMGVAKEDDPRVYVGGALKPQRVEASKFCMTLEDRQFDDGHKAVAKRQRAPKAAAGGGSASSKTGGEESALGKKAGKPRGSVTLQPVVSPPTTTNDTSDDDDGVDGDGTDDGSSHSDLTSEGSQ